MPNVGTFFVSIIAALVIWMLVWRYTIPRLVGKDMWAITDVWSDSLHYPFLSFVLLLGILIGGAILSAILYAIWNQLFLYLAVPIIILGSLALLIGLPARHFIKDYSKYSHLTKSKLLKHYLWMVLLANAGYLVFCIAWAGLNGLF